MTTFSPVSWDDDEDNSEQAHTEDEYSQDVDTSADSVPAGLPPLPTFGTPVPFNNDADEQHEVVDADEFTLEAPSAELAPIESLSVVQLDAFGNEVQTSIDLSAEPLTVDEAREITNSIRSTTNVLYVLIKRAHVGKAWAALGHNSFKDYVTTEFNYSRSYAYKLLDQANVIEAIETAAPEGTKVYVSESIARDLKKSLPELEDTISDRTEGLTGEESKDVIEDIIREHRERESIANEETDEDFDNYTPGEYAGNGNNAGEDFSYLDDDEDDEESLDEYLSGNTDPAEFVKRLDSLYIILSGLKHAQEFAQSDNLDDLLPLIPPDRFDDVDVQVVANEEWATRLREKWEAFRAQQDDSSDEDSDEEDTFYSE